MILDGTQHGERHRLSRAHNARTLAMRALRRRSLDDTCPEPLARHLQKAEVTDAAYLDAGTVMAQRILEAVLHLAVVAPFLHVDEVDDDQPREVPELQLTGEFLGCFQVGLKRGFLDRELTRGF